MKTKRRRKKIFVFFLCVYFNVMFTRGNVKKINETNVQTTDNAKNFNFDNNNSEYGSGSSRIPSGKVNATTGNNETNNFFIKKNNGCKNDTIIFLISAYNYELHFTKV